MAEATATDASATSDAHDDDHPTERLYVQVAAALFVLTMMEFSSYFIEFGVLHIPLLLVLMSIKFALVVGFFMHLKYDTRLFTRLMSIGLAGAVTLYGLTTLALLEFPAGLGLG